MIIRDFYHIAKNTVVNESHRTVHDDAVRREFLKIDKIVGFNLRNNYYNL